MEPGDSQLQPLSCCMLRAHRGVCIPQGHSSCKRWKSRTQLQLKGGEEAGSEENWWSVLLGPPQSLCPGTQLAHGEQQSNVGKAQGGSPAASARAWAQGGRGGGEEGWEERSQLCTAGRPGS